jgi:NIPSNAP
MADGLYEFRDYWFRRDLWDEYKSWWEPALEYFSNRFDVIGLWFDSGISPRITGADPMDLRHGSANVTWILRWESLEERDARWPAMWDDPEWTEIWAQHPDEDGYLHMSVRFMSQP